MKEIRELLKKAIAHTQCSSSSCYWTAVDTELLNQVLALLEGQQSGIEWVSVKEKKPVKSWSSAVPSQFSNELLVCNSAGIALAFYNREDSVWYTGCPAELAKNNWIDKITHWAELPKTPHDTLPAAEQCKKCGGSGEMPQRPKITDEGDGMISFDARPKPCPACTGKEPAAELKNVDKSK